MTAAYSGAGQVATPGTAGGAVGAGLGLDRAADAGHVALVHDVGFGRDVPGLRELVVPGGVVLLQIVVGVFAVVDAVGAEVEVVVDGVGGVADAGGAGGFGVGGPEGDVVAAGDAWLDEPVVVELDGGEDRRCR